jgi:hypothetical protein
MKRGSWKISISTGSIPLVSVLSEMMARGQTGANEEMATASMGMSNGKMKAPACTT